MEATVTKTNNEGVAQFLGKDFKKAEEHFKKALQEDGSNSTAMSNLGLLYHNKHKYDMAVDCFRKAISIAEKDTYYLNLANALVFLKSYAEAEEAYQKSLELNPRNGNAMLSLARFHAFMGNPIKATPLLEKLALGTGGSGVKLELSKNYISLGYFEKALTVLFPLRPREKDGSVSYYIGLCEFHLKNYGLAKTTFLSALSQNPDYRSCRHYLALTHLYLGEYEESLKAFNFLIKLFPEETKYRLDKIAVLMQLKRHSECKSQIEQVLKIDPHNPKAKTYESLINGINSKH